MRQQKLREQKVEGEPARPEDEHGQGGEEKGQRGGGEEFVGVAEDGERRLAVGGEVGDEERDGQRQRRGARGEADHEQQAADTFHRADKVGLGHRQREAQALEKAGDFFDVLELAFAGAKKLPAPVKAHGEEKDGLEIRGSDNQQSVAATRDLDR